MQIVAIFERGNFSIDVSEMDKVVELIIRKIQDEDRKQFKSSVDSIKSKLSIN